MAEKAKRGLGTGLGALFSEPEVQEETAPPTVLPISRVEPRSEQPRKEFEPEALEALAESIREYGLIQPITVRALDKGYYQIIAGERRWRAARMAGLREVPVRILEADDKLTAEMALVENLQREDLNPLEEARGYKQLMLDYELTQEEVAKRVQKSRSAVANSLRLLGLSAPVLSMVEKGTLSAGHARALLPLTDATLQLGAAKRVVDEQLSVRQTEALAARLQKGEAPKEPPHKSMYTKAAEEQLTSALGRAVRFTGGVNKGKITLEFYSADDREALMTALMELKKK